MREFGVADYLSRSEMVTTDYLASSEIVMTDSPGAGLSILRGLIVMTQHPTEDGSTAG